MNNNQRSVSQVPVLVVIGLALLFVIQMGYHHWYKTSLVDAYKKLDKPSSVKYYSAVSMGSERLLSYLMLLGVQLHDNQKGQHVSYINLNYETLKDWLLTLYELNPLSDYPAFLASRVYSQVPDESRTTQMIEVIEDLFNQNPQQHWRRMTEACLLAKHQLKDLPLALRLAQKISALPKSIKMPYWARDMELVLLDELNQYESAQLLISSMLESGDIKDADEIRFLQFRLLKIQQALLNNKHMSDKKD